MSTSDEVERRLRMQLQTGGRLTGYVVRSGGGQRVIIDEGRPSYVAHGGRKPKRRQVAPAADGMVHGLWTFTDHVCRECLGRIMLRMDGDMAGWHRCSNCGGETGEAVETLCACGMRLPTQETRDLGFRCVPTPDRTFEFPAEISVIRDEAAPDYGVPLVPVLPLPAPRK